MSKEDFRKLYDTLLPLAQKMLEEQSSFIPFGAMVSRNGDLKLAAGAGDISGLTTEMIIEMYLEQYRNGALLGFYRSVALCMDVRVAIPDELDKTDAIRIMLEDDIGVSLSFYIPYESKESGPIVYGQEFASMDEKRVFNQHKRK